MIFADADQPYDEAEFVILGIPYEDKEMSFREGTSDAPDFIRYESWNYESYCIKHNIDLQDIAIHDAGNFNIEEGKKLVKKAIEDRKMPVVIGGAHSITPHIISSLPEDFGVVILDAHMDFRNEYLGSKQSHACTARRIFEAIGGVISFGIRSASQEEIEDAKRLGFKHIFSWEFSPAMADEIPFKKIYLSIDMDVFDPCHAPGVSNPEPNGLGYEIFDFIEKIANRVMAMDVVEVCPAYDDGRASLLAAKLIRDFIACKAAKSQSLW